ncbi:DUF4123 domain-containing protein [Vibrio mangrovi]|uniref:DUF4123 domain-containing protein n=1 Tax=Vibrio mangrovi TaxID=474394 RepID=A0A1Y6IXZ5_9VIBR|nr:DUF4123 domain-containing protein [Vibrio mangrovi]MDW6001944.1 DUF4123 domain-containing protein [Vibrio mangrovi]SMS02508.1 hypothetical protein VIM7927_03841 [Vibrio mangrovi]
MTDTEQWWEDVPLENWQTTLEEPGWFVVAEAAIHPEIRDLAEQMPEFETRLYWGDMGDIHASISPYIMPLQSWAWLEELVATQPHWGIAIQLDPSFHSLPLSRQSDLVMRYFRAWTLVETPTQEQFLLRLSDWDVLGVLWQASDAVYQQHIQGPLRQIAYWEPGQPEAKVLRFQEPILEETTLPLPTPLTEAQYQVLSIWASRQIYRQYQDHLQAHHSETQNWEQAQFDQYIHQHVTQANQFGFQQPNDVVRYLSLTVVFGEQFTTQPWAEQILKSPDYQGTQSRMDRLFERGLDELDKESEPS